LFDFRFISLEVTSKHPISEKPNSHCLKSLPIYFEGFEAIGRHSTCEQSSTGRRIRHAARHGIIEITVGIKLRRRPVCTIVTVDNEAATVMDDTDPLDNGRLRRSVHITHLTSPHLTSSHLISPRFLWAEWPWSNPVCHGCGQSELSRLCCGHGDVGRFRATYQLGQNDVRWDEMRWGDEWYEHWFDCNRQRRRRRCLISINCSLRTIIVGQSVTSWFNRSRLS